MGPTASGETAKLCSRDWISFLALGLSRHRKMQAMYGAADPERFLDERILSTSAERDADWLHAQALLAADLMADPSVARLTEGYLPVLEEVWLDQVKERMAYLTWLAARTPWSTAAQRLEHYLRACRELKARIGDVAFKRKLDRDVVTHLRAMQSSERLASLTARKVARGASPQRADSYVRTFFDGILLAIEGRDPKATARVLAALEQYAEIVSALEMFVATAFLDTDLVKSCWRGDPKVVEGEPRAEVRAR